MRKQPYHTIFIVIVIISNIIINNQIPTDHSVTFSAINNEAIEVFTMQRYRLIREFSYSRPLPPPLSILYRFICFLRRIMCCKDKSKSHRRIELATETPEALGNSKDSECYNWEQKMLEEYDKNIPQKDNSFVAMKPEGSETNNVELLQNVQKVLLSTEKLSVIEESIKILMAEATRSNEKLLAFEESNQNLMREIKAIKELVNTKNRTEQEDATPSNTDVEMVGHLINKQTSVSNNVPKTADSTNYRF